MISFVIPVLNEEKTLFQLYSRIGKVMHSLKVDFEIIFVDDGSIDSSLNQMLELKKKDDKVKIITFRKNFGKSAALTEGFEMAQGDIIFSMDADLQDAPEEIPNFIDKLRSGYDLVSGWRHKRKDVLIKTIFSKFYNVLVSYFTGINIHDCNCGFKAYRKSLAKELMLYGELHRYIPPIAKWMGYKVGEVEIRHYPRLYGKSKYNFKRLLRGFVDLLTVKFLMTFGQRPSHFFSPFGFLMLGFGLVLALYLTYRNLFVGDPIMRPLTFFTMVIIIGGLHFISLGFLGELLISGRRSVSYVRKKYK